MPSNLPRPEDWPSTLSLGYVPPGTSAVAEARATCPSAATVAAAIEGRQAPGGGFAVASLALYQWVPHFTKEAGDTPAGGVIPKLPPPGGGPGGLTETWSLELVTEVAVDQVLEAGAGEVVGVRVAFAAPASGPVATSATLRIESPVFLGRTIGLEAQSGAITVSYAPGAPMTAVAVPGSVVQTTVTCTATAATSVETGVEPPAPADGSTIFSAAAGQTITQTVAATIQPGAQLGQLPVTLTFSAFGGGQVVTLLPPLMVTVAACLVDDDDHVISQYAGEVTSAVIPPGTITPGQAGRFLAVNDWRRPTAANTSIVTGRDLDQPDGPDLPSAFAALPSVWNSNTQKGDQEAGGNDNDLVVTPGGDVLFALLIGSREALSPKPAWFDVTYRGQFGPGARSTVAFWRSTDAGASFQYVGEMDAAKVGDGSGAGPQISKKWPKGQTDSPGSAAAPVWDMGGTDGPTTVFDRLTGVLYVAFQVVGNKPDPSVTSHYALSTNKINTTLLVSSADYGATWTPLATIPESNWRWSIVPVSGSVTSPIGIVAQLALVDQAATVYLVTQDGAGTWTVSPGHGRPDPPASASSLSTDPAWKDGDPTSTPSFNKAIWANVWTPSCGVSLGNGKIAVAAGAQYGKVYGYDVRIFDAYDQSWQTADKIVPQGTADGNAILHLTAVSANSNDPSAPVLLYWYDINYPSQEGSVRGRLLTAAGRSDDFALTRGSGAASTFDLDATSLNAPHWYGDYKTASGYADDAFCYYFPVWAEPDQTIHFTQVIAPVSLPVTPHSDTARRASADPEPPPLIQQAFPREP